MQALLNTIILAFTLFQTNPFIKEVVSREDALLCFVLKAKNFEGKVVIEGTDLFSFCFHEMNITEKLYDSLMVQQLQKGRFEFEETVDLKKYGFHVVKENQSVSDNVLKGKEAFLKVYFDGDVFRSDSIGDENYVYPDPEKVKQEQLAVIYQLFQWNIAVVRDCETGIWYILDDKYLYNVQEEY